MTISAAPTWTLRNRPWLQDHARDVPAGVRVIVDNDFAGDPDDLVQLAHHLLCTGVELRAVICSHLGVGDPFDPSPESAANGLARVRELLEVMRLDAADLPLLGTRAALVDRTTPQDSPGVRAIIEEARREDDRPLFVAVGGGLTDIASAWLLAPDIAERLTVVWIGGPEYPDLADPAPGNPTPEYNLGIDITAGQVVFEDSDLAVWQVPRDAYRQCLLSDAELRMHVASAGELGRYLYDALESVLGRVAQWRGHQMQTYCIGDQPLVLLTALLTVFEPSPAGCRSVMHPAPRLSDTGKLLAADGRDIRVFTHIDTRLMVGDLFASLAEFARWRG